MKLCDLAIVFGMLFLCAAVPLGLRTAYLREAQFTTEEYNRCIDRAATDCLMDVVEEEYRDGSIRIDGKAAEHHFYEQLFFVFDAQTGEERERLSSGVKMMEFVNRGRELTMEEADALRIQMEERVNRNYEADGKLFALYFPYIDREDWYEKLRGRGVYVFYDVRDDSRTGYDRFLFAGSRIKKE